LLAGQVTVVLLSAAGCWLVGATMDAVCAAAAHPELREQAVAGGHDIAAAVRGLRANLARMTTLADADGRHRRHLGHRRRPQAPPAPT
jgi:hypothetical protein